MKINKNKKLYISLILILVIIITFGILLVKKIEAPIHREEFQVKETVSQVNQETILLVTPSTPAPKYKIVSRSVVAPEDIKNKNKIVLLTIDDGPGIRTTQMIEILKKHNAKAIFFINGMHDKNNPDVISTIDKEGFYVGNHTWSHINLKKQKDINLSKKEITKNADLIKEKTGKSPKFFRAPYGESNPEIRNFVKENGMIFMDWSGAAMDWNKSTVEKDVFVGNVMKNIHSGSIILIHEHPWSLANLDALLTDIESKGYSYVDPNDIIE